MKEIISQDVVSHIANLAKIKISKDEIESFQKELNKILDYFKKIDEVDTKDVKPTWNPIGQRNVLREDKKSKSLDQKTATKNAPEAEKGYIKAPRI